MPNEVIDLRKQSSLMRAVHAQSQAVLVAQDDNAHASDTRIFTPSPIASRIEPSPAHVLSASLAHDDIVPTEHSVVSLAETNRGFDLEWSSYEHEYRTRGPYWFLYPLTAATGGIVFGIATYSYLFIAFVAIAFLMLTYYAKQPPRMIAYAIEKRGVWVGDRLFHYGKLKSFWIFTHALMAPELLLETNNPVYPLLHLRLEGIDPDAVKDAILRYLPEKEQKDLASHQIARIIGF